MVKYLPGLAQGPGLTYSMMNVSSLFFPSLLPYLHGRTLLYPPGLPETHSACPFSHAWPFSFSCEIYFEVYAQTNRWDLQNLITACLWEGVQKTPQGPASSGWTVRAFPFTVAIQGIRPPSSGGAFLEHHPGNLTSVSGMLPFHLLLQSGWLWAIPATDTDTCWEALGQCFSACHDSSGGQMILSQGS